MTPGPGLMAKPRGSRGSELAIGRAADRVSEKEAEGEESPPGPDCICRALHGTALASDFNDFKAAILGAAVSLLAEPPGGGTQAAWLGGAPPPTAGSLLLTPSTHPPRPPPPARLSRSGQNLTS